MKFLRLSLLLTALALSLASKSQTSFEGTWVYVDKSNYKDYLTISRTGENYLVERVYKDFDGVFWNTDGSFKQIFPVKNGLIDLGFGGTMGLIENGTKILFGGREYLKKGTINSSQTGISPDLISSFDGKWVYADKSNYKDYLLISKSGENYLVERVHKDYDGMFWNTDGSFKQILPVKNGLIDLGFGATIGLIANGNKILFGGKEYTKTSESNQQINTTNLQASNVTKPSPKEINYSSFKGYMKGELENYCIRFKKVNFTGQYSTEYYVANKVLEILPTIKRISQPPLEVSDTLNLIANIDLSFNQEKSVTGEIAFFAISNYSFSLISSKTGATLYQNNYSKSNQGLLARGFSTQEQAAIDVFNSSLNQYLNQFIIGNFPISATITEVTETSRKKDEAKFVKIDVGKNQGIYTGFEFLIPEINNDPNKGDLIAKEVYDTYTICKVTDNEKKVLELINAGNKIKIKTKYKP